MPECQGICCRKMPVGITCARYLCRPYFRMCFIIFLMIVQWVGSCLPGYALEPDEIVVLANRNVAPSVELARYYMEKRGIPAGNLVQLWVTDHESCSREDYERKVLTPVRRFLEENNRRKHVRCLVITYGLPLKIASPPMSPKERAGIEALEGRKAALERQLNSLKSRDGEVTEGVKSELEGIEKELSFLSKADRGASLDSEIALVLKENYSLSGWIPNPFFAGNQGKYIKDMPDKGEVMMVSRLDGPSDGTVRRIIDESVETEKTGLKGAAYFDARWPRPREEEIEKNGGGYGFYDRSIHLAAQRFRESGRMRVVVNDKPELFQPGECPDAALYCGWYSLGRYVDAFTWRPGSVGYHIASAECRTLKQAGSQIWCKRMLEKGVAATIGPVNEPYVQAFPVPEIFFGLLVDGYWSLAECYALSQPFWSWQMVLIGDPLYRPFRQPSSKD